MNVGGYVYAQVACVYLAVSMRLYVSVVWLYVQSGACMCTRIDEMKEIGA